MLASDVKLNRLKLRLTSAPISDLEGAVASQMRNIKHLVNPGYRVAVTAGSRGVANIAAIIGQVVKSFKEFGANPFIIPAMGSHGGATAEGQRAVLAGYGITEDTMGVPILSSMETVRVGEIPEGLPVFIDKYAYQADGIFAVGRVKPATDFHGEHESGIVKMLCIGLGKHDQAKATHAYLIPGLRDYIPLVAKRVIETGKVLGALGIVEDGHDETSVIRVVPPEEIHSADKEMLIEARRMMPRLPFETLDIMLVDRMGKDVSGTGMDTNIIGRMRLKGVDDCPPFSSYICLFDLTDGSHGNALGIGLADLIPRRLYNKVDWQATYENVVTSHCELRGFTPVIRETDRDVVDTALRGCGPITPQTVRLLRFYDTLHIGELFVSNALLKEVESNEAVELLERGMPLAFDEAGNLAPLR